MWSLLSEGSAYERTWWHESIVYQIYVHSFKDSSGDGIGDLGGVLSKLDYLNQLGVDIIQLSPIYDSGLADMGYDVRDHRKILPAYGSMNDWKTLLNEVHKNRMRLIMDLVVNSTSDEHAFFQESRSSRDNPKSDWYIWRDPNFNEKGERIPPNNWESTFGGSAWTWEERRRQYYLHLFTPKQPDLNWDNPAVRNAAYEMTRWWLDMGVDGFRLTQINSISKAHGLPDAPVTKPGSPTQPAEVYYLDGPNVHTYLKEMHQKVFQHYDVMTVGEMSGGLEFYEAMKYIAKERKELSMVFHFGHLQIDEGPNDKWDIRKWKLAEFKEKIQMWQQYIQGSHGWNSLFFHNHDQPSPLTRFTSDDPKYRAVSAKMLATLQFSLSGTPFIYQGAELGMVHPKDWKIEDYKDVETKTFYKEEIEKRGTSKEVIDDIMSRIHQKARENSRIPMPWNGSKNGGFTDGEPWLKLNSDYPYWNAEEQMKDPSSVWNYYKTMIHMRKTHPSMFYGGFTQLDPDNEIIFAYVRSQGNFGAMTVLNWRSEPTQWTVPEEVGIWNSLLMIGNYPKNAKGRHLTRVLDLQPWEARIYSLRGQ